MISGRVRTIIHPSDEAREDFAANAWTQLLASRDQRYTVDGYRIFCGNFKPVHGNDEGKFSLYTVVSRTALLDDPTSGRPRTQDQEELEELPVYLLSSGYLVLADPVLRTRVLTKGTLRNLATRGLQAIFGGLFPGLRLGVPSGERSNEFFIDRILDAAGKANVRLKKIEVSGLEHKELGGRLTLFNPDPDPEALGQAFWPHTTKELERVSLTAAPEGDLSHNPLARGFADSGETQRVTVAEESREDHGRRWLSTTLDRRRSDKLDARTGRSPSVDQEIAAIARVITAGDYEVDPA